MLPRSTRRSLERSARRAFRIMQRLDGIERGVDPKLGAGDVPRLVAALDEFTIAARTGEVGTVRRLYKALGGPVALTDADVMRVLA